MTTRLVIVSVLLLAVDASSAEAQKQPKKCSVDSVAFSRVESTGALRDCDVDRPARFRSAPTPRLYGPPSKPCVSATLEFVVDSTGVPEPETAIVFETDDRDYAEALLGTVSRWRYSPAELNKQRVSQVVRERRTLMLQRVVTYTTTRSGSGSPPPMPPSPPPPRLSSVPCR